MISKLNEAGHTLTDEQHIYVVIRSLPHNWKHIKVHLTYNQSIKTLNNIARHLELEEDCIEELRPNIDVYMASSSLKGGKSFMHNSYGRYKGKRIQKA